MCILLLLAYFHRVTCVLSPLSFRDCSSSYPHYLPWLDSTVHNIIFVGWIATTLPCDLNSVKLYHGLLVINKSCNPNVCEFSLKNVYWAYACTLQNGSRHWYVYILKLIMTCVLICVSLYHTMVVSYFKFTFSLLSIWYEFQFN